MASNHHFMDAMQVKQNPIRYEWVVHQFDSLVWVLKMRTVGMYQEQIVATNLHENASPTRQITKKMASSSCNHHFMDAMQVK